MCGQRPLREELQRKLRGNGQPAGFVYLAVQVASSADMVKDLLDWIIGRKRIPRPLPPPPPLAEWLALYRNHREVRSGLARFLGVPADVPIDEVFDALGSVSRMSPEEVAADVATLSEDEKLDCVRPFIGIPFPPSDADLRAMLEELDADAEAADEEESGSVDEMMSAPVGQFFFRVWLPCWIMHREYATSLLFLARHGDLDAMDKLIRLDKSIVQEPRIAEHVHQIVHTGSVRDRALILNALAGKPKGRMDRKSIRHSFLGLISQIGLAYGTRVPGPDIAALFDGIERVRREHQSDSMIPVGEALTKSIQRNRTWPSLPTRLDK